MINEKIIKEIIDFSTQKKTLPKYYMQDFFKVNSDLNFVYFSLLELLKTNDVESISYSLNFITFLINNSDEIPGKRHYILLSIIEENFDVFEMINEHLRSPNIFIRQLIIDKIHYFKYEDCLNYLIDSIDYYFIRDPINIPQIIIAIINLSDDIPWDIISKTVKHNNFVVRWSFLYILGDYTLDFIKTCQYLEILLKDEKMFISIEANYYYNKLKTEEENNSLNYFDKNDVLVSFDEDPPIINFADMYFNFLEIIRKKNESNYSTSELDAFIDYYIKNKESLIDGFLEKR